MSEYKIAIVTWVDIVATDTNWRDKEDAHEWADAELGIVNQVGYLIYQDIEYILLADSFFPCSTTVGSVTKIPMGTVRDIKIIE